MRLMPIVFSPGMDQSMEPALLQSGALTLAENLRATKSGRLAKRPAPVLDTPEDISGNPIAGIPNLVGHSRGNNLYAADWELYNSGKLVGSLPAATPRRMFEVHHPGEYTIDTSPQMAIFGTKLAVTYMYRDGRNLGQARSRLRILDLQSGLILFDIASDPTISVQAQPRIQDVGATTFRWFYAEGDDLKVRFVNATPAIPTIGAADIVPGVAGTLDVIWGFIPLRAGLSGYYNLIHMGDSTLIIDYRAPDHSVVRTENVDTSLGSSVRFDAVSDGTDGGTVYIAWSVGAARARVISSGLQGFDSGVINVGGSGSSYTDEQTPAGPMAISLTTGGATLIYPTTWDSSGRRLSAVQIDDTGTLTDLIRGNEVAAIRPYSRVFEKGGRLFFWGRMGHHEAPLRKYQLFEIRDSAPKCIPHLVADGLGIGDTDTAVRNVNAITTDATGEIFWCQSVALKGSSGEVGSPCALRVWTFSLLEPEQRQLIDVSGIGAIPGGVLCEWEGAELSEAGLAVSPQLLTAIPDSSGSLTTDGNYIYSMAWERVDYAGRVHRSAPATPLAASVSGGNRTLDLTFDAIGGSSRAQWGGRIYRTVSDGSILHRLTQLGQHVREFETTHEDTQPDSSVGAREVLYISGGVLPSDSPPASQFGVFALGRLWLGGLFESNRVRFSFAVEPGLGLSFPEDPTHWIDFPSRVTGLAALEDALIVFTETDIFAVGGEGPDITGASQFPPPRRLATDLGCIDWRSVLATSIGVFYKSASGLMLLPRGGSLAPLYVGQAISDVLTEYPHVAGAQVHGEGDSAVARFLLWDSLSSPTKSKIVSYSLRPGSTLDVSAWTVETAPTAMVYRVIGNWTGGQFVQAGDSAYYVEGSGDSPTSYLPSRLATGELTPGGIGALWRLSRVWLHVIYRGPCVVSLAALYDGKELPALPTDADDYQSWELNSSDYTAGELVRLEWRPRRQEAERVRLFAADTENADPVSHGVDYVSATLELEPVGPQQIQTVNRR